MDAFPPRSRNPIHGLNPEIPAAIQGDAVLVGDQGDQERRTPGLCPGARPVRRA